jgi:hypothetical protein
MCLTCGCKLPHEDHGKPEYLTIEDLEASAKLDGFSLDEALANLEERPSTWRRRSRSTSTGRVLRLRTA